MRPVTDEELRRTIESARRHIAAQRAEAARLEAELPGLNERLGAARRVQEHMQHPTTLVTESARERLAAWTGRLRRRAGRG